MNLQGFLVAVTLLIAGLSGIAADSSLTCYQCDNVQDLSQCKTVTDCTSGQVCVVRHHVDGSFSQGCTDNKNCPADGAPLVVGKRDVMSRDTAATCTACCTSSLCNKHGCQSSVDSACVDSYAACDLLLKDGSGVSICKNDTIAKTIGCQRSCGLCASPADGGWSVWSQWSGCPVTCGQGQNIRLRTCSNPVPQANGRDCPGNSVEHATCHAQACAVAVDGQWSDWSQWRACSATCGGGETLRVRTCNNPLPQNGGKSCPNPASAVEKKQCNTNPCIVAVDGQWSDWSQWRACSATCGGGETLRVRTCNNPMPQNGGKSCPNPASAVERNTCNTNPCVVDGHWSDWSQWQPCSATCGGGQQLRVRTCSNPLPQNGGKSCANPGSAVEKQPCNNSPCTNQGSSTIQTTRATTHAHLTTPPSTQGSHPTHPPAHAVTGSVDACVDSLFCTDSHIATVACSDTYVAATYCPRMCGLCGPGLSSAVCQDRSGSTCQEPTYQALSCSDPDLTMFCEKTCGKCH